MPLPCHRCTSHCVSKLLRAAHFISAPFLRASLLGLALPSLLDSLRFLRKSALRKTLPPQHYSHLRWSSPRRFRTPRFDAMPSPCFAYRCIAPASRLRAGPLHFLSAPSWPFHSVALPFCTHLALPSRLGSAHCHCGEGENHSSRSSSTS
jgi:hypothetical protein